MMISMPMVLNLVLKSKPVADPSEAWPTPTRTNLNQFKCEKPVHDDTLCKPPTYSAPQNSSMLFKKRPGFNVHVILYTDG